MSLQPELAYFKVTLWHFVQGSACSDMKKPDRTITGECNNPNHPTWGSSTQPFTRLVSPNYADNKEIPRGGHESAVEPGNTGM